MMIHIRQMIVTGAVAVSALFTAKAQTTPEKAMEDQTGIIAKNSSLNKVSGQFSFTEGPARDKEGNVFFTDQPNDKIWKYDTRGRLSVFMDKAGRSNGMFFAPDGNLISCADENNQLWRIDMQKNHN